MGEAEKVLSWLEKSNVSVSFGTVLATLCVLLMLAWVVYTKYFPSFSQRMDNRVNKQVEKKRQSEQFQEVMDKQKEHDKQFSEMYDMLKNLSDDIGKLNEKLEGSVVGQKVTLSVLLDIVECMQATTSPEECGRQAQSKINSYLGVGKLPLQ